jgi:protein SCO1/2
MNPRVLIALFLLAVFALGATVLVASGGGDEDDPSSGRLEFEGAVLPDGVRAPRFELRDQDGEPVRMADFEGPVIVTFLYTHCDESCPPQAQQIKGALVELEEDVPALAIALEPERDTPASARHFLSEQGMSGKMDFVLGSRGELERVWCGFAILPQGDEPLRCGDRVVRPGPGGEHQARIVLVDGGFQRVGFPLEQATPERIAHDVRVLQDD